MSVAFRNASPHWVASCGLDVIEIGDNVRLSAIAVYAALALSHKHGDYNRYVPISWIVIARSLRTACR